MTVAVVHSFRPLACTDCGKALAPASHVQAGTRYMVVVAEPFLDTVVVVPTSAQPKHERRSLAVKMLHSRCFTRPTYALAWQIRAVDVATLDAGAKVGTLGSGDLARLRTAVHAMLGATAPSG